MWGFWCIFEVCEIVSAFLCEFGLGASLLRELLLSLLRHKIKIVVISNANQYVVHLASHIIQRTSWKLRYYVANLRGIKW